MVLITGGNSAVAGHLAHSLATRGARDVVVIGADRDDCAVIGAGLAALGTHVSFADCDPADREAPAAVVADIVRDRRLAAVFHVVDGPVSETVAEAGLGDVLDRVGRATAAMRDLNQLTADLDLDAFVLFGSFVGTTGAAGYAVLAHPLLRAHPKAHPAAGGRAADGLAARLAGLPGEEQERVLVDLIRTSAATVLGHDSPDLFDGELTFLESGFSSFTGLELRDALSAATGLALPLVVVFDHPTPGAPARHLRAELAGAEEGLVPRLGTLTR